MSWPGWALIVVAGALSAFCQTGPALHWSEDRGFRSRPVAVAFASEAKAGFTRLDPHQIGVTFTNTLSGDLSLTNAVAHNGAGVAIGDVNGDGWADIYLCHLQGPNRLYLNQGDWRFSEASPGEAACADEISTGAAFADVEGDGDLDLFVNGIAAGTRLFLNDGQAHWTEFNSGLSRTNSAISLAMADIDGDGDLDLYCTHYVDYMYMADPTTKFALGRRGDKWEVLRVNGQSTRLPKWKDRFEALPDGKVRELAEVDGLYRNDGQGRFTPIQFEPGIFADETGKPMAPFRDWGLAVMFRDLNGDLAPDIYICNDMPSPDRVWINSGRGTFRAMGKFVLRHTSRSSMGIDFADINRDGLDDFVVVDMLAREHSKRLTQLVRDVPEPGLREHIDEEPSYNRNMLFLARSDGTFAETAFFAGIAATDWSWCPVFVDVDLDGFEDLLITNGFEFDVMDQDSHDQIRARKMTVEQMKRSRQFHPSWSTPNAAFRNRGDGVFEPKSSEWGFDASGISYGMALGDLDNDGDLDVVINNLNAAAGVYRNKATAPRIAVRLLGNGANRQGIGAQLILSGGPVIQSQEMICGGRYASGDDAMRVFATGTNAQPLRLEVTWRDGTKTRLENLHPNHVYVINQRATASDTSLPVIKKSAPLFEEVSAWLAHSHHETPFDDWARQPLLPWRLSRSGPGVSWSDLNDDGWDDLIIGSGSGGVLGIFTNHAGKAFGRIGNAPQASNDYGAVLLWRNDTGQSLLLAGTQNVEAGAAEQSSMLAISPTNFSIVHRWNVGHGNLGPMGLADLDGDQDLDLFVGGRARTGRYPQAAASSVWLHASGELQHSEALSKPFDNAGIVNGVVLCDLDGDGDADVALATEWGPVRIFENQKGQFIERTKDLGLSARTGWWTGIAAGDFDGDGRIDLAVGNRGRNSPYELFRPSPIRLFHGDWNGDAIVDLMEAWSKGGDWFPIRNRTELAQGLPEVTQQFTSHERFARARVREILGERYANVSWLEVNEFESGILLNRPSRFEWIPLPRAAQLAPVFSINAGDLDGDGREDLFLSQNFFGTRSDISREDSGQGLWLRGHGDGTFEAMDALASGISIFGEQRGAALADFNQDGRLDLAVTQNHASTKLFLNNGARRGLRISLRGPMRNRDAIGAQVRVRFENGRWSPSRAVLAGSGYWSQDGKVQVLGCPDMPESIWIRWPDGKERTVKCEREIREVRIAYDDDSE
jgi:enediyne biosynthesis protein E4